MRIRMAMVAILLAVLALPAVAQDYSEFFSDSATRGANMVVLVWDPDRMVENADGTMSPDPGYVSMPLTTLLDGLVSSTTTAGTWRSSRSTRTTRRADVRRYRLQHDLLRCRNRGGYTGSDADRDAGGMAGWRWQSPRTSRSTTWRSEPRTRATSCSCSPSRPAVPLPSTGTRTTCGRQEATPFRCSCRTPSCSSAPRPLFPSRSP